MSEIDDQRMKDLADRLVAMSPEPPPFPEETTVTQPTNGSKKQSPVLIFVGAAAIVIVLALIPILLMRGGGEVAPIGTTTTSTVPSTQSSEPVVTSTSIAEVTTTVPETTTTIATVTPDAVVYLVQTPENSNTGNPALVPFRYTIITTGPIEPNSAGLAALTDPALEMPDGFNTLFPAGLGISSETRPEEHLIVLDMSPEFLDGAGGLLADFTMLNQLIYTATQFGEIESVLFTVDGQPVTAFGSEGLDLSEPVARDSFLDQVNSILVTFPVQGEDGMPLVVSGVANVFEAHVTYEVLDANGDVVKDGFTMATCGTGCWGGFSFEVQYAFTGDETVRVFEVSMKDGSPTDVVTIPILWNDADGWDLISGS